MTATREYMAERQANAWQHVWVVSYAAHARYPREGTWDTVRDARQWCARQCSGPVFTRTVEFADYPIDVERVPLYRLDAYMAGEDA